MRYRLKVWYITQHAVPQHRWHKLYGKKRTVLYEGTVPAGSIEHVAYEVSNQFELQRVRVPSDAIRYIAEAVGIGGSYKTSVRMEEILKVETEEDAS